MVRVLFSSSAQSRLRQECPEGLPVATIELRVTSSFGSNGAENVEPDTQREEDRTKRTGRIYTVHTIQDKKK